jgi:hypothetical protein
VDVALDGQTPIFGGRVLARLDVDDAHGWVVVVEERRVAMKALGAEEFFGVELAVGAAVLGMALVGDIT